MSQAIESWVHDVRAMLAEMALQDFGYPIGVNQVNERAPELPVEVPPALRPLYSVFDGLSLPDVWNGYFIDQSERFASGVDHDDPTQLKGEPTRRICVFGSNGGGGRFALDLDDETIYYLPSSGAVYEDRVFQADRLEPVVRLAGSVMEFLDRLKADIEAFVHSKENHTYMPS